jgi:hypothetical protein
VVGWFVRHRGSRWTAARASAAGALALTASNAPLWAQQALSFSMARFPGDFVVGLLMVPLAVLSLVLLNPSSVLFRMSFLAGGALCGLVTQTAAPVSSRARRARYVGAPLMMAVALLLELSSTPTAWSPRVNRRIADFDLPAPPRATANDFHAWARKQLHVSLPPDSTADAVLSFYDGVFAGWRRLDRTADDSIWVDPTVTVMAWVHVANANASVSLSDFDRAAWSQRFRRTAGGESILDLARGDVR